MSDLSQCPQSAPGCNGMTRQNLFFAFIYNAPGAPVAAGVLYPFFGILQSPIIAACGDGEFVAHESRLRLPGLNYGPAPVSTSAAAVRYGSYPPRSGPVILP